MPMPDYQGGSIVNLMSSILEAAGGTAEGYPPLALLENVPIHRTRNLVLLVVDGLGWRYLQGFTGAPNLKAHLLGRMTSVFPSTTASAVTSFLTGTAPQQHALTGWFMYLRELGTVAAVLPLTARQGGQRLQLSLDDVQRLFAHDALPDRIPRASHIVYPARIADSLFSRAHAGAARIHAYPDLDGFFATISGLLDAAGQKYVFAYWPDFDATAHQYGIASAQAAEHLRDLDRAFGAFLDAAAGSDTTLLITADHGLVDTDEVHTVAVEADSALSKQLLLPLCGERRAAYCYPRPGRADAFAAEASAQLGAWCDVHRSEELLGQGYFGLGAPHPRLHERIGELTLLMRANYVVEDRLLGEAPPRLVGVHGGLSDEEIYVPLMLAQL